MELFIAFLIGAMYIVVGFILALLLKALIDESKKLNTSLIRMPLFYVVLICAPILVVLLIKLIYASFVYFTAGLP